LRAGSQNSSAIWKKRKIHVANTLQVRETVPAMPGADERYRNARAELHRAEAAMRDHIENVAAMRRSLPDGPKVRDYEFRENGKLVRLSELFADGKPELIVYHLMYWTDDDEFCPMCSMWVDGLNAVAKHVEQRANIVVTSIAPPEKLSEWAKRRGWNSIRVLADEGDAFARDLGAQDENGEPVETVAVFVKDGSTVRNTYLAHAFMFEEWRFIDLLTPVWHLFDLLPSGRGEDWHPSNDYANR
jgi:predicted dithiol-disulfide oxidoreductase (DUF899 family)